MPRRVIIDVARLHRRVPTATDSTEIYSTIYEYYFYCEGCGGHHTKYFNAPQARFQCKCGSFRIRIIKEESYQDLT